MRRFAFALMGFVAAGAALAQAEPVALVGVHIVHVEDGRIERSRTVVVRDGRIDSITPEAQVPEPGATRTASTSSRACGYLSVRQSLERPSVLTYQDIQWVRATVKRS